LTEILIKTLIIVILIAAIIVFQSDIRRMIDLAWFWTNIRSRGRRLSSLTPSVDILTEAIGKMSERRTGALMVIRGKESCDRHLTGGIPLEGRISAPLLYSIFNTSSPGHDGAVIIEGDRIFRFGAHLPLSENIAALGEGSTRHAAGLGLSERCDAFVIILSEERGTISIAHDGQLTILKSTVELKNRLGDYYEKNFPQVKETDLSWWNKRNILTVTASIVLAIIAWFIFAYHSDIIFRNYTVPIEFKNLTTDYSLTQKVPSSADVTIQGSEQDFRLLDPSGLVISLDLGDLKKGKNDYALTENKLELPTGLSLYNVEPKKITLSAVPTEIISIPVRVQTSGRLSGTLKLISIKPIPETVQIIVPKEGNNRPGSILTEPIDLNNLSSSTSEQLQLLIPKNFKLPPEENGEIEVEIKISK
jgi:uncharacterized protein (TIGR00159 family)